MNSILVNSDTTACGAVNAELRIQKEGSASCLPVGMSADRESPGLETSKHSALIPRCLLGSELSETPSGLRVPAERRW